MKKQVPVWVAAIFAVLLPTIGVIIGSYNADADNMQKFVLKDDYKTQRTENRDEHNRIMQKIDETNRVVNEILIVIGGKR